MNRHSWVVSNPPHGDVDHDEAAEMLGITRAESRMKANFSAPEVWLAYAEGGGASEAVTALKNLGLNAVIVRGHQFANVPWPEPAASFAFEDDGFVATFKEGTVALPYDSPVLGVFCRPPANFEAPDIKPASSFGSARGALSHRSTSAIDKRLGGGGRDHATLGTAEALERATNLDLYVSLGDTLRRITISSAVVDFSGLGKDMRPRGSDNVATCVDLCERRFTHLVLDTRLVNVRPRRRPMVGGPAEGQEGRRLFSFGTHGLRDLLESASPHLGAITQFELGSRLAYLMHHEASAS